MSVEPEEAGTGTISPLSAEDVVGLLDRVTDGVVVLGRDLRVRYLSDPAAAMLGHDLPALSGRPLAAVFPEVADHPFQLALEEALASGQPQRVAGHYAPSGRWFEVRMVARDDSVVVLLRDVTERVGVEDELREHVHRIAEAERIARFGVWEWDVGSGRVRWSDELHRIYGMAPGEFSGTVEAFIEQVHPDDRERVQANIAGALETKEPFVFEERIVRADGVPRVLLSIGRVVVGTDGAPKSLVGVCRDVTERVSAQQALGASERRMRAILDNSPSMITVKDLDGRYLMSNSEAERIVGVGSDTLVGQRCDDLFSAQVSAPQRAADRRAASEGEPVYTDVVLADHGEARTYRSVTFALPDDDGRPAETCTIATDVTERRERESERRERLEWTERIGAALAEDRLVAFGQPIVRIADGSQAAVELLVRMRTADDQAEILLPDAFLPAAERYGLTRAIDVWMVRRALALAGDVVAHVNLSAVTICDPAARREITSLLQDAPRSARRIVFEITETASVEHLQGAREFVENVTDLGSRLALDDFGVGFGALTYLRALPASFLKVDRSFVRGLTRSAEDRRVVRAVIGMAREFGLETVVEGIEDAETLELVAKLGADYAQGYFLGRPAPLPAR